MPASCKQPKASVKGELSSQPIVVIMFQTPTDWESQVVIREMSRESCIFGFQSVHGNSILADPDPGDKPEWHLWYVCVGLYKGKENAGKLGLPHRWTQFHLLSIFFHLFSQKYIENISITQVYLKWDILVQCNFSVYLFSPAVKYKKKIDTVASQIVFVTCFVNYRCKLTVWCSFTVEWIGFWLFWLLGNSPQDVLLTLWPVT